MTLNLTEMSVLNRHPLVQHGANLLIMHLGQTQLGLANETVKLVVYFAPWLSVSK